MLVIIWTAVLLAGVLFYFKQQYTRFSKYGVKHFKPLPFIGTMGRIVLKMDSFADNITSVYSGFPDERFVGRYEFLKPTLLIRDLEVAKRITVKDFEHFMDHQTLVLDKEDVFFGRNLLSLKGQEWKDMRSTLSPAFTSSKMRMMLPLIVEVGYQMTRNLKKTIKESKAGYIDIDGKDLTTRYTNDVIATCAFGLKVNSHAEKNNKFYQMGKEITSFSTWQFIKLILFMSFPKIVSFLKSEVLSKSSSDFFNKIVLDTMNEREIKDIYRPDMIHLLMEVKKGKLTQENNSDKAEGVDAGFATVEESSFGKKDINRVWKDTDLVAQAILFFFAGFETVSSAMSFALHELAVNPDVQKKLYDEIIENEARCGGKFDYKSIQDMKYMDMVVSEVLRLWPPIVATDRMCVKDYNLGKPNDKSTEDYVIRKGEGLNIPVWCFHRDPAFFTDPLKFNPERFSEQNRHNIKPFTYMPFGLGPRNCIGSRFALCEVKVMLYQLLQHLELFPNEKTCIPAEICKKSFQLKMKGGHWVRLRARN